MRTPRAPPPTTGEGRSHAALPLATKGSNGSNRSDINLCGRAEIYGSWEKSFRPSKSCAWPFPTWLWLYQFRFGAKKCCFPASLESRTEFLSRSPGKARTKLPCSFVYAQCRHVAFSSMGVATIPVWSCHGPRVPRPLGLSARS